MKTILCLLLLVVATVPSLAVTISQWTFESPPSDLSNSSTSPSVAADVGTGTASGLHASASTDWSTPVGNGSANSLSVNTWAVGDYFQFHLSTAGFDDIVVSFDQASSSTGPAQFNFDYSTDGANFTTFQANYAVLVNAGAWVSGSHNNLNTFVFDLTSLAALENAPDVYFRLVNQSTVAATGTDRIDNFAVSGEAISTSVPETLPLAFAAPVLLGLLIASRRLVVQPARCVAQRQHQRRRR